MDHPVLSSSDIIAEVVVCKVSKFNIKIDPDFTPFRWQKL